MLQLLNTYLNTNFSRAFPASKQDSSEGKLNRDLSYIFRTDVY